MLYFDALSFSRPPRRVRPLSSALEPVGCVRAEEISFAVAIWAMHFVGMLAVRLPFPVDYLALPHPAAVFVCVIVVGGAIYAISSGSLTPLRLSLSSVLMGAGIFTMHYIGMTALHSSAHMIYAWSYVVASLVVAIAASGLALWLAAARGGRMPLILSATVFGIAVSGMHYTAMAGVTLFRTRAPSPEPCPFAPTSWPSSWRSSRSACLALCWDFPAVRAGSHAVDLGSAEAATSTETAQLLTQPLPDTEPGEAPELGRGPTRRSAEPAAPPRRFA